MAIFRVRRACILNIPELGRTVDLREGQALDSDDPLDAAIIAAHPTQVRRDSVVEAATAAPGELRETPSRETV
jgi:hypothetical protein